jgi:hypothetical protein
MTEATHSEHDVLVHFVFHNITTGVTEENNKK